MTSLSYSARSPPAATIEVRFEDGAVRAARTRGAWWVYAVGGDEIAPGRRPVQLIARDGKGTVLAREAIDVSYFFDS